MNKKFMEYMQKGEIKATPITKIVKKQNLKLTRLINSTKNFWTGWCENLPKGKVFVSLRPHILISIDKQLYLFRRVEITQYERLNIKDATKIQKSSKELLLKLLDDINIKRVRDEDGQNGLFARKIKDKYHIEDSAYCYINPFISNGYWENHILETKYIEII